jgi:hypothetical protein
MRLVTVTTICSALGLFFLVASPAFAVTNGLGVVNESLSNGGTTTQYSLFNTTDFAISAFAVTTTGSNPSTSNANWTAQALNASLWTQPMGGNVNNLTWQQYTGLTYLQAYPEDPTSVNGYFLNYTFNSGAQTVSFPNSPFFPANPLFGGFFFQGTPDSDFLVVGPPTNSASGPTAVTSLQTLQGQSVDVPEPSTIALGLFALAGCGFHLRCRRCS